MRTAKGRAAWLKYQRDNYTMTPELIEFGEALRAWLGLGKLWVKEDPREPYQRGLIGGDT